MNYCSECGQPVEFRVPEGDNLCRHVCTACGMIHYRNPKIVAGCIPLWEGRILLCRRAIEPRHGLWTIPAGFMENGETIEQAAVRETREEACAELKNPHPYALYNLPQINQVYAIFIAEMASPAFSAGAETLEAGLYDESEIPWEQLAFPVVRSSLRHFFKDRAGGDFIFYMDTLERKSSHTAGQP